MSYLVAFAAGAAFAYAVERLTEWVWKKRRRGK